MEQPYDPSKGHHWFEAHRMAAGFQRLQYPRPFLPPQSALGREGYLLGGGTSPAKSADFSRRTRLVRCSLDVDWVSGEPGARDRRWYNPERRHLPNLDRRWVEAEKSSALLQSEEDKFILISYNILGVSNSLEHPDLYMNVPFDAIRWESRKHLICEDIRRSNADVVCLQEVDRFYDLERNLKKDGYAGRYKPRTGHAKDGCAIFWKNKRFHLLEEQAIEFSALGLRENVAQLFVFETDRQRSDSRRVIVGNIHVLFNPKRGDIKLGQVRILLQQAHVLSEKWGGLPVVLAGDFNSTPESAIYEFLSTSELNITKHDRRFLSGQERFQPTINGFSGLINHSWTDEELINAAGTSSCDLLTHPLKLRSAYACIKGCERTRSSYGEPLATSYHSKFMGTVDYLWYSGELEPARVLDTIPIAALKSVGGLPSKNIGSDHLHLASEFIFIPRREELNITAKEQKRKRLRKNSSKQAPDS
ncbi:hypothetical protein KSP39_PZI019589 [Platanthera zijinensis]|uniref:Endonuclease/exonuclease/phosphatase domain-containing protein n=1 Tax=Platanthera zijinensis TaxID=2320716 RepID=A0AAP0B0X1_9ASPA